MAKYKRLDTRKDVLKGNDIVAAYENNEVLVVIKYDDDPMNPRDWDNVGTMLCAHRRYNLGDEQVGGHLEAMQHIASECGICIDAEDEDGCWYEKDEEVLEEEIGKKAVILPLYLYDHSGITMSTSGFSCPWDSGQVGVIFVTLERAYKEYGGLEGTAENPTEKDLEQIRKYLQGEVKTYDDYLTGNVYGFETYEKVKINCDECACKDDCDEDECDGYEYNFEDSCWGFFIEKDVSEVAIGAVGKEVFDTMEGGEV